jgi:hypothetical protein
VKQKSSPAAVQSLFASQHPAVPSLQFAWVPQSAAVHAVQSLPEQYCPLGQLASVLQSYQVPALQ